MQEEFNSNIVSGSLIVVNTVLRRPADAIAYAALDVISDSTTVPTLLTFQNIASRENASGYIVKSRLMTNQSTNVARHRLHLFHTTRTAINDNTPYTLLYANADKRIGHIDFPACVTEGTGSLAARSSVDTGRLAFVTVGSRNIFGVLQILDASTPTSEQLYFLELTADVN